MIGTALFLLAFKDDKPEVDVSAHLPLATNLLLAAVAMLVVFFLVRPELWRRMWFDRIDPRPAAVMRIAFGLVVLWTFVDLIRDARFLFTDEGMWLTKMARKNYGGKLSTLWDPEHGFEHWYDIFVAMWGKFSILHFRSDPGYVYSIYAVMLVVVTCMILGLWTRPMTVLSWILVEQVYRYSPLFYTGGDTVVRVFMFAAIFCRWGEAYSIDAWRRRRKAILGGAREIPPLRLIPAWPQRLMMIQLCIIYSATGLLKSGATWANGTAMYYSLCLDHFYRFKEQIRVATFLQWIGLLPALTVSVRWWEVFFPVVLIGVAINAFEREKAAGIWPQTPLWRRLLSYLLFAGAWGCGAWVAGMSAYYFVPVEKLGGVVTKEQLIPIVTAIVAAVPVVLVPLWLSLRKWLPRVHLFIRSWVIGRRTWLIFGFFMHIGIDIGLNVGTFAEVMMAAYFAWPTGDEVDRFWRYLGSRPAAPGEAGRPVRKLVPLKSGKLAFVRGLLGRIVLSPLDRLRYRKPAEPFVVHHRSDEASVRRAALLRLWDLEHRLQFRADDEAPARTLVIEPPNGVPLKGRLRMSDRLVFFCVTGALFGAIGGATQAWATTIAVATIYTAIGNLGIGLPWLRTTGVRTDWLAADSLLGVFPGLFVIWPLRYVPFVGALGGWLALRILRQRA
jgi:hypothetical protein